MSTRRRSSRLEQREALQSSQRTIAETSSPQLVATKPRKRKSKGTFASPQKRTRKQSPSSQREAIEHVRLSTEPQKHTNPRDNLFDVVEFKVGPDTGQEQEIFYINKALLAQHSAYFSVVSGGEKSKFRIRGESAEAFAMLQRWLYTKEILDNEGRRDAEIEFQLLTDLNILADKLGMADLVEQVMDAFTSGFPL